MDALYDRLSYYSDYVPIPGSWQLAISVAATSYALVRLAQRILTTSPRARAVVEAPLGAIEENYPGTRRFVTVVVKDNLPLATLVACLVFTSNLTDLSPPLKKAWVLSVLNNRDPGYWLKALSLNVLFIGMVCKFGDVGRQIGLTCTPRVHGVTPPVGPVLARIFYSLRPSDRDGLDPA